MGLGSCDTVRFDRYKTNDDGKDLKTNRVFLPVLTNLGEKMSDDEVDELLKAVDTSSGEINYTGNCAE